MKKRSILAGMLLVVASLIVQAGDVLSLKQGHPQTYVVKKGDTLWGISSMFLSDPWMWPEIWHVNPQVDNPHLIFPGDELNLVYIDGKPRLVVKRGRDIKLNPSIRISDLDRAIPAIPLEAIAAFLSDSRVLEQRELEQAPYVLSGKDGHIIAGAGDELYARGDFSEGNSTFGIFRKAATFTDPDSGEFLGIQAFAVAEAKLLEVEGDVANLALNATNEEVRRGDRLLPDQERSIRASYYPSAPEQETNGYIIAVEGGVSQIGSMDVVVINKGARDGIKVGDVMAIYRTGEQVRDQVSKDVVKLPDSRAGILMVFRSFDKVSYALVLKASRSLSVMDKVRNP